MTTRPYVQEAFKRVVDAAAVPLKRAGFARRDKTFRKISGENVAIVEFQRSMSNTAEKLRFTVNLAIVCYSLQLFERPLEKAHSYDGQLVERIGWLLPKREDKWWELTAAANVELIAAEVSRLVEEKAIPFLLPYLDTGTLIALWESGEGPGLTKVQRLRYLEMAKASQ